MGILKVAFSILSSRGFQALIFLGSLLKIKYQIREPARQSLKTSTKSSKFVQGRTTKSLLIAGFFHFEVTCFDYLNGRCNCQKPQPIGMLINKRIPLSYILGSIKWEIVIVTLIGITAYFLQAPIKDYIPDIPLGIPAFLGTSISVIISFKLSQSYDRWWEARKIWGSIVNDSRTLVLQLQSFLVHGSDKEIRKICFRHIGWCFSLGQSLRGQTGLENMERYLSPEDIDCNIQTPKQSAGNSSIKYSAHC